MSVGTQVPITSKTYFMLGDWGNLGLPTQLARVH